MSPRYQREPVHILCMMKLFWPVRTAHNGGWYLRLRLRTQPRTSRTPIQIACRKNQTTILPLAGYPLLPGPSTSTTRFCGPLLSKASLYLRLTSELRGPHSQRAPIAVCQCGPADRSLDLEPPEPQSLVPKCP